MLLMACFMNLTAIRPFPLLIKALTIKIKLICYSAGDLYLKLFCKYSWMNCSYFLSLPNFSIVMKAIYRNSNAYLSLKYFFIVLNFLLVFSSSYNALIYELSILRYSYFSRRISILSIGSVAIMIDLA